MLMQLTEQGQRFLIRAVEEVLVCIKSTGWEGVERVLSRQARAARALYSAERRTAMDTLHMVVRGYRYGCTLLETHSPTAEQLTGVWLHPERYAQKRQALQQACEAEVNAETWGAWYSYPTWLVRLLLAQQGPVRTRQLLETQNQRAPLTVRINTLKITREAAKQTLQTQGIHGQETALSETGIRLEGWYNVATLNAFQEGWIEVQDEGSQLLAELVAPAPGEIIVDACAGAGGKTLALGVAMHNKGRLLAWDVDETKLQALRERARRAGLTNVHTQQVDLTQSPVPVVSAQRVLCDVPCSGIGVLRRHPVARWLLSPAEIQRLVLLQQQILQQAATAVSPGGLLVYGTCTVLAEENETQIEGFLTTHPGFSLVPVQELWGATRAHQIGDGTYLRIFPTDAQGPDGFFAAVLRKTS